MLRPPLLPLLRVGALLLLGAFLLHRPRAAAPLASAEDVVWATDVREWGPGELRIGGKVTGPLPDQKRPPCEPRAERELVGACWEPHLERPPCPAGYLEGAGMCLKPVRAAQRLPTSIVP